MERIILTIIYRFLYITTIPFFLFLLVYSFANENSNDNIQYWNLFYIGLAFVSMIFLFMCKHKVFKMLCECLINEFDKTDFVTKKSIDFEKGFTYEFKLPDKPLFVISCNYGTEELLFKFKSYYLYAYKPKKKFWIKPVSALNNHIKISLFFYTSATSIINHVVNKERRISSNYKNSPTSKNLI